jgi:SAM-dependent methyltransferase
MDASSPEPAAVSNRLAEWFGTPLGQYLLRREQAYFDRTVADIFGFNAIQVGLPGCPFLAQSRIAACWSVDIEPPAQVLADPQWLPFPENSLDLVVLPHALEFTDEPHKLLREVYRTVRPEGQVVLAGFNPFSLFGAKRYFGRGDTPPWTGNFIALYRLKDWLALLGFEVTGGSLDCYVPPFKQEMWLRRCRFFRVCRRSLVADRGRRLFPARHEARARHARHHPRMERRKNGLATAPRQVRESIE